MCICNSVDRVLTGEGQETQGSTSVLILNLWIASQHKDTFRQRVKRLTLYRSNAQIVISHTTEYCLPKCAHH
eukprot:COSAG02_NODE_66_length_42609_cov_95.996848_16_plen_72_part_00